MTKPLTYTDAEAIAAELAPRWQGITGLRETPNAEQLADLVQFVRRWDRVIQDRREGDG